MGIPEDGPPKDTKTKTRAISHVNFLSGAPFLHAACSWRCVLTAILEEILHLVSEGKQL